MLNLSQIEQDLTAVIKARDQVAADTLRGLKTRIQKEKSASGRPDGKDLSEEEIVALVRSEVKRRKEAAESFAKGGRQDAADKELKEAQILEKYLPPQMSEEDLGKLIDQVIAENNFTAKDFGKAMGAAKAKVGSGAEGGLLAKLLKEKLK